MRAKVKALCVRVVNTCMYVCTVTSCVRAICVCHSCNARSFVCVVDTCHFFLCVYNNVRVCAFFGSSRMYGCVSTLVPFVCVTCVCIPLHTPCVSTLCKATCASGVVLLVHGFTTVGVIRAAYPTNRFGRLARCSTVPVSLVSGSRVCTVVFACPVTFGVCVVCPFPYIRATMCVCTRVYLTLFFV